MAKSKKNRSRATKKNQPNAQSQIKSSQSQVEKVEAIEAEVIDLNDSQQDSQIEDIEVVAVDDQVTQQALDELDQDSSEDQQVQQVKPADKPVPYTITHRTSSQPSGSNISDKARTYSVKAIQVASKPRVWLGAAIVVATLVLATVLWWQWQRSYVAVVNGQYVPTSELLSYTLINGGSQALPNITQRYLIEQEAQARGITIPQDVIDAELQTIIDDSGGQVGYEEALEQYGIPESHIIQQIRTRQILVELTKDNINITDEDVQRYYDDNKDNIDPDGSRGFDNIKDLVRTELTEQRQESEFANAVQTIQEKSKVSTKLEHANLSFTDFLKKEIFSIPSDIGHLFSTLAGN